MALKFLPIDKESKDSLLKSSEVLFEFRTFLSKKYKISEADADVKIRESLQALFGDNKNIDNAIENALKYVESEGFDKTEELKKSVLNILDLKSKLKL